VVVELYQRYAPALLRKCKRVLQHRADTEDIVHGLFVDLLGSGKTDVDLPYLYRAVTNRCLNHLRDKRTRQRLLAEHDVALRGPVRNACDERVIGLDLLFKLRGKLDDASCEVLVYRYFDDMQLDEIAELIGTSRRTVSKRLAKVHKAVGKLMPAAKAPQAGQTSGGGR
jgi:RNA polymerase sigma factor (sigma-70 family)